ncbi:MAG: phosphodiester glycosidase family protein [Bacilli bacterium]|nr:phosphodiester glycosidase family protein [Bacilli bacterium]MDD4733705.1 phosphodiester glycosidase family protein [Bacilli bacterium]
MKKKTIIIIILDILALLGFLLFYGPISNFRVWYINTAMNTMTHRYLAYIFYSDQMIYDVMNANYYVPIKEEVNLDEIVIDTKPKESYDNKYDEEVLTRDSGNEDYKIIKTKVGNYDAIMAVIYDPSKVKLIESKNMGVQGTYPEKLKYMCSRHGATICITGGGNFRDSRDFSTNIPMGHVIKNGEIISSSNSSKKGNLIGFNKDNKLVLTRATGVEALEMGIRDAVEWFPYLIVNGKSMQKVGDGGFGNAARTTIAQRKDGVVLFLVVNACRVFYCGPTLDEVIKTLELYGAYNAANLDGGASTQLVEKGKLLNIARSSDGDVLGEGRGLVNAFAYFTD